MIGFRYCSRFLRPASASLYMALNLGPSEPEPISNRVRGDRDLLQPQLSDDLILALLVIESHVEQAEDISTQPTVNALNVDQTLTHEESCNEA